jgi:16S rRNA (adenine1518-N6/adenine1519-N6)-dimethyltransferase
VLVQRELADRLGARVGTRDWGSLAALHALCVRIEKVRDLPPACFFPQPKVHSTLVRVTPLDSAPLRADELGWVERVLRAAFGTRRKTLGNALRTGLADEPSAGEIHAVLERLAIPVLARAEALDAERLLALARALRGGGEPPGA